MAEIALARKPGVLTSESRARTGRQEAAVVAVQIGRPLRAGVEVVNRCHLGLPVVVAVPPVLDDGTPFPTRYWLTCPLAVRRVGRLESAGGVKDMEARAQADEDFGAGLAAAHAAYAAERDRLLPGEEPLRPSGGVGGAKHGIKCLHAHYAHTRAGRDNPAGDAVALLVEPLDCAERCVVGDPPAPNPKWREPRRR